MQKTKGYFRLDLGKMKGRGVTENRTEEFREFMAITTKSYISSYAVCEQHSLVSHARAFFFKKLRKLYIYTHQTHIYIYSVG